MDVDGCDILHNDEHISEDEERERLERKRAYNREYQRRKRESDPDASREFIREYMRKTGKAKDYYQRKREQILERKKNVYAMKKNTF